MKVPLGMEQKSMGLGASSDVLICSCGPLDLQVFMDHPGYHIIGAASCLPVAEELSRCLFTFIIRFIKKEGFRSGFNTQPVSA